MKILHVVGPSTGGIRRHVAALAEHQRADGHDVVVAAPDGVLADARHLLAVPDGLSPFALVRARRALRAVIDLEHPAVVHAHGLKPGWLAASLRSHPPLVVSVHNLVLPEVAGSSTRLLQAIEGRLPGMADATIAISHEVARRFRDLPGADRIHVVPPVGPVPDPRRSPAEVRADLGVAPDADLVVTPARLHPQKDLHLLLDAASAIRRARPRLAWFVFGDGPLQTELEREIARRGLDGVVHLAGRRPDVDAELAAADVVAITSRWESGPLVVLEALALRRPVVSTAVGLVPDVIGAADGVVVPPGDAEAFAEAVVRVLDGGLPSADGAVSGSGVEPRSLAAAVVAVYREVSPSQ